MFFAEGQIRVHLYGHPCDMRKSFPWLYALTLQGSREDPFSEDLFVFISRRATQWGPSQRPFKTLYRLPSSRWGTLFLLLMFV